MRLCAAVAALWLVAPAAAAVSDEVPVVVVHEGRPESDLSAWRVRVLAGGEEPLWENGDRVRLLLPPEDSGTTAEMFYAFVGISPLEMRKTWVDKVFRGEAVVLPVRSATVEELIRELQQDPGGIGILPAAALDTGVPAGLKVLTVGGKQSGDEGYPLADGR